MNLPRRKELNTDFYSRIKIRAMYAADVSLENYYENISCETKLLPRIVVVYVLEQDNSFVVDECHAHSI